MPYILITYIFVAFLIFSIPKSYKSITPFILSGIQLGAFLFFISQVSIINNDIDQVYVYEWIPAIGLNFEFALTGLSLAFVLLITGIGALVFLYAGAYMKSYSGTDKFYFYSISFSAAMLGLVLSANMIQLFIFGSLQVFILSINQLFHEKNPLEKQHFNPCLLLVLVVCCY